MPSARPPPHTPPAKVLRSGKAPDVITTTMNYLMAKAPEIRMHVEKPTAVFDVDECLLWWRGKRDGVVAREDVRPLWDYCMRENWNMVICTARPKSKAGMTYLFKQLQALHFHPEKVHKFYMMGSEYKRDPGPFKADVRLRLRDAGLTPVVMVGDQWTDVRREGDALRPERRLAHVVYRPDPVTLLGIKLDEDRYERP